MAAGETVGVLGESGSGKSSLALAVLQLLPANAAHFSGEVLYQVNKTRDGYLVLLMNNRGVDKTPSGVARVDRRQSVDVVVRSSLPVRSATEYTEPRDLALANGEVRVTVHPGDVQVVYLVTQ